MSPRSRHNGFPTCPLLCILLSVQLCCRAVGYSDTVLLSSVLCFHRVFALHYKQARQNVCIPWHWGALAQPLLLWTCNTYYIFWVWVCSLRYEACKAHAPYCQTWFYNIFPRYFIKARFSWKKKLLSTKCVFWSPLQLLSETFLILRFNETWIYLVRFMNVPFVTVRI